MPDQGPEQSSIQTEHKRCVELCTRVARLSDIGRHRRNNQDYYLVLPVDESAVPPNSEPGPFTTVNGRLLLAVADGMGGHFGGEVASRMCCENLAKELPDRIRAPENGQADLPTALRSAIEVVHRALYAHAQSYAEGRIMGTTLTAVLIHDTRAELAQIGDSRAYLFRAGKLILLTQDQTIGSQLSRQGQSASTVDASLQNLLIQAVGAQEEIKVSMGAVDLEPDDVLLVCCDGLSKVVSPEEIVETLELEIGLEEKAAHLVGRANENGGPDNITVILAEIRAVEGSG
ncbi:MAG TPA: protein phosphatase 2C domain-containing protein [Terriglobales bacterium]|nr:protein phosphatase 2C domain-containing protein [Terriglobales bacterium]